MMCEILAPVGGQQQLLAAVRCGADAVYLGLQSFNARRNADNFDGTSLAETVSYCHARGVRVHVTVNTLVTDDEFSSLEDAAAEIAAAGVDAVIIQDLAVLRLFRDRYPTIARHASTQMTVHNTEGAQMMRELGFDRVVLSRELSLEEIRKISQSVDIELEAFVHGALCMSISGGCYLSSMLGGRSGNRGLCAQPCRLEFRSGNKEYALSLKDMSHIRYISAMREAGVVSFKIEGRMKRPEYVAAAVTACRNARDGKPYDEQTLQAVFSRSGFTDGYLTGKRSPDMFGHRRRDDVVSANSVFDELAALYRAEPSILPISISFEMRSGSPAVLTAECEGDTVTAVGPVPEPAKSRPTEKDDAFRALSKTGGTPFFVDSFDFLADDGLFLPVSAMNAMRRDALDALLANRGRIAPHAEAEMQFAAPPQLQKSTAAPKLRARFEHFEQITMAEVLDLIVLPVSQIIAHPESVQLYGEKLAAELPSLSFPETEDRDILALERVKALGVASAVADNIYAVRLAREMGFKVHGGWGLNITNSIAAEEYSKLGLLSLTASFELSMDRIKRLAGAAEKGVIAYGYLPLMRMRACPAKHMGCAKCGGNSTLTDRKGIVFPLLCSEKRYTTLLNSVPLYIGDRNLTGLDFAALYFTTESRSRCETVLDLMLDHLPFDADRTGGLYYRELK